MGFLSRVAGAGGAIALSSAGIGTAAAGGSGAGTASDESDENGSDGDNGGDTDEDGSEALSDVDVLNFALTLEHLEAAYYDEFLSEYSESEIERSEAARVFADPGSRFSTYQKIQQVRDHGWAHVETLTATIEDLGGTPVEPAEHDFPYETIDEFVSLSATIEAVGVSAYAGATPLIENDDVLAAALSIHSVEARHTAYFRVLDTNTPFPNAFDPTWTMEEVLDVASQFIVGMDSEGDSDGGDGSDENDGSDDDGGKGELSLADLRATAGSGDDPRAEYAAYENTGQRHARPHGVDRFERPGSHVLVPRRLRARVRREGHAAHQGDQYRERTLLGRTRGGLERPHRHDDRPRRGRDSHHPPFVPVSRRQSSRPTAHCSGIGTRRPFPDRRRS